MRLLLIIEDDAETRTGLGELLSAEGYSVCEAADAAAGLQKLRTMKPDLVLLDHGLPAIADGERFLRAKSADPGIASVPVVVVSGYTLPPRIDGVVAIIAKPFDFERLLSTIADVVGPPDKPQATAA